jgi:hypothetical protein
MEDVMAKTYSWVDHVVSWWIAFLLLSAIFLWLMQGKEVLASTKPAERVKSSIATDYEKHCMIQTALGEATPGNKKEVIEIMRGMLTRRASGRWGDLCGVVNAHKQYSVWNNKRMPAPPRKQSKRYRQYAKWAELALNAGPSRFDHYYHKKAMMALYNKKKPYWARQCVETARIGTATFCRMS